MKRWLEALAVVQSPAAERRRCPLRAGSPRHLPCHAGSGPERPQSRFPAVGRAPEQRRRPRRHLECGRTELDRQRHRSNRAPARARLDSDPRTPTPRPARATRLAGAREPRRWVAPARPRPRVAAVTERAVDALDRHARPPRRGAARRPSAVDRVAGGVGAAGVAAGELGSGLAPCYASRDIFKRLSRPRGALGRRGGQAESKLVSKPRFRWSRVGGSEPEDDKGGASSGRTRRDRGGGVAQRLATRVHAGALRPLDDGHCLS